MKTRHTPEPWFYKHPPKHQHAIHRKWEIVAKAPGGGEMVVVGEHTGIDCLKEFNAARIVACVNACEGMTDPAVEISGLRSRSNGIEGMCAEVTALRSQVAELAGALEFCGRVAAADLDPDPYTSGAQRLSAIEERTRASLSIREV